MSEKTKLFFVDSWKWILTSALLVGINIGIAETQLATKTNSDEVRVIAKVEAKNVVRNEARVIVKEEIENIIQYYFSETEGKVLQNELKNIQTQLNRIEKKLDERNN